MSTPQSSQNNRQLPAVFEEHTIRRIWHEDQWWFSVIDVIGALTKSGNSQQAWYDLKRRMKGEGADQVLAFCQNLKFPATDGKLRATDCADTETMLRIIQSVPPPKAEPFKLWLAQVGTERLEEMEDPEAAYQEWRRRAVESYKARGYSDEWAENREMIERRIGQPVVSSTNAIPGSTGLWDVLPDPGDKHNHQP